ncbi:MAG TPA: CBS domain-containing protein [Clostridia bacterium]|nr:CBS domain-containing protein [Clostridia bacterium]
MLVRNYMTPDPVTITRQTTIAEALDLMRRHNVRRLPVMDRDKLVGIVTDRDLSEISPSPATSLSIFELNYLLAKTKIGDFIPKKQRIYTIEAGAYVEEAALLMREHKVGALPVMEDNRLMGIITETNIFDAFINIMGLKDPGSRITLEAEDKPGVLAEITQVIRDEGVNISRVAVFRNDSPMATVVLRLNIPDGSGVASKLKEYGYQVNSVKNHQDYLR